MTEFVVDSVSSWAAKGHYIGDAPHPTEEPENHYFKKPIEERLALRTGQRAAEGWRLVSTSAAHHEGSYTVFLFFERDTRTPSRAEPTRFEEPERKAAAPIPLGPGGGGGTGATPAPPTARPTAQPTARPTAPPAARPAARAGSFSEWLRRVLRGDR